MHPSPLAAGTPYHRLAWTEGTRWWTPLRGTVAVVALDLVGGAIVLGLLSLIHTSGLEAGARLTRFDLVWELGLVFLGLGLALPAVLLVVRFVDRRPLGSVTSVQGRFRWRWFGSCLVIASSAYVAYFALVLLVDPPALRSVDWALVAAVAVVVMVLVPLQSAAEEYVFRGYLTQAIGVFAARPWLPAILTALLFAAAHGTEQGTWLFANRVGFGLVAAWLVFRTGGLEAPIALHCVPNILSFVTTTADGNLGMFVRGVAEPVPPAVALLDLAVVTVVAAWLARSARSRGIARVRPNSGAQRFR